MINFQNFSPNIRFVVLCVLVVMLIAVPVIRADQVVIQPDGANGKDARINSQQSSGYSSETISLVNIQTRPPQENRVVVQFNLSAIPSGAVINSVSLQIYGTGSGTIKVMRITNAWAEDTVNWSICGMNYPTVLGSSSVVNNGFTSWDVTGFVTDVLAGTYANNGFSVAANSSSDSLNFYTSDNSDASKRPKLVVDYQPGNQEVVSGVTNIPSGAVLDYSGKDLVVENNGEIKVGSGSVEIKADNLIIQEGGKITANGGSSRNGGTVEITTAQDQTINGKITARGKQGGKITLTSTSGKISLPNTNSVVNGSGNSKGGRVKLKAGNEINISGKVRARGRKARSHGGKIELEATSGKITLSVSDAAVNSSGDKKGGRVKMKAGDEISISGKIRARGRQAGSHGGKIDIRSSQKIDVTSTAKIKATGKRKNGKITLRAPTVDIDPGAKIKPKPKIKRK